MYQHPEDTVLIAACDEWYILLSVARCQTSHQIVLFNLFRLIVHAIMLCINYASCACTGQG